MLWNLAPSRHVSRWSPRLKLNSVLGRHISLSYVEGPTQPALVTSTLGDYFSQNVLEKYPRQPALICRGELPGSSGGPLGRNLGLSSHLAWDYEEFDLNITATTRGLLRMGVKKGDRVDTLNTSGVKHLFIVPQIRTSHYTSLFAEALPALRESTPGNIQEPSLPDLQNLVVINNTADKAGFEKDLHGLKSAVDWRDILAWREDSGETKVLTEIARSLDADDITNLIFTSGTTGNPKAVSLTHNIFLNNSLSVGHRLKLTHEDIVNNAPPLFHSMDKSTLPKFISVDAQTDVITARILIGNFMPWLHGSAVAYPSASFEPSAVVNSLVGDKCTTMIGVPTHFHMVYEEVVKREMGGETFDFSRLSKGINGGALVPELLMKKLKNKMNLSELAIAFGMTENLLTFQTKPDDPVEKLITTCGTIQAHMKIKLVDENGATVPIGVPGEVWTAGYSVCKGYWNDEEKTLAAMHRDSDGTVWMKSGDLAVLDEDGYLKVVSRIKDIIIRAGENISPGQIDDVLMAHPAVLEASAVAVPDEEFGEVVGAWVVLRDGQRLTKEQGNPTWVWFTGEDGLPDELPKTASGKVQKHVLRTWSRELVKHRVGRTI
ncbi:hypothetical protein HWV62_18794 [Athelia sp. TMB]|nr:hypothetical protein HWV62_18794 [Athelia sp. TMB]